MKKRQSIRVFLILLCAVLLCSVPAYAVDARASERIDLSMAAVGKTDSGDIGVYFMVGATGEMDVLGASSVEIQRKTITGWVTEHRFTSDSTPELLTTNSPRHSAYLIYSPIFPGKTYRAVVMIYVKNATGVSTQKVTSESVT